MQLHVNNTQLTTYTSDVDLVELVAASNNLDLQVESEKQVATEHALKIAAELPVSVMDDAKHRLLVPLEIIGQPLLLLAQDSNTEDKKNDKDILRPLPLPKFRARRRGVHNNLRVNIPRRTLSSPLDQLLSPTQLDLLSPKKPIHRRLHRRTTTTLH